MIAYLNGSYIPRDKAVISAEDRGFNFADGVYEVILSYSGRLFGLDAHMKRLRRSIDELRIPFDDIGKVKEIAERLLKENDLSSGDATVYIQITRGYAPRKHGFPPQDVPPTLFAYASAFKPHEQELNEGIKIILKPDIRWSRCDIKSVSLLPNVLAYQEAKERGAVEAVFMRDGAVTEGSHTSVFAVFDNKVFTAPKSHYILSGITRDVVLDLCRKRNIPFEEFPILESRIKKAEEFFITSTTSEVTPVVQIDEWMVGNGKPGPVTRELQDSFKELIEDFLR